MLINLSKDINHFRLKFINNLLILFFIETFQQTEGLCAIDPGSAEHGQKSLIAASERQGRRIVKDRIHPADCAVYVPDMAGYAPVLRQFAEEMGIPMRFSQKQLLLMLIKFYFSIYFPVNYIYNCT